MGRTSCICLNRRETARQCLLASTLMGTFMGTLMGLLRMANHYHLRHIRFFCHHTSHHPQNSQLAFARTIRCVQNQFASPKPDGFLGIAAFCPQKVQFQNDPASSGVFRGTRPQSASFLQKKSSVIRKMTCFSSDQIPCTTQPGAIRSLADSKTRENIWS